jgi:hypothetical protein
MTDLKRLVLDYRTGELVARVLYSTQDGPGPNTKARAREVSDLVREGLQGALEALQEGSAEVVGTSGYSQREDVLLLPTTSSSAISSQSSPTRVKGNLA